MAYRLLSILMILSSTAVYAAPDHAGPENVLVIYNMNWPDYDGNGQSDSKDLADYYSERRGIPAGNVLGVHTRRDTLGIDFNDLDYDVFFDSVLTPVYEKLQSSDGSVQYKDKIYYIALMSGFPYYLITGYPTTYNDKGYRCLDMYLINVEENYTDGYVLADTVYRPNSSGSTSLSWYNHITGTSHETFKEARDADRASYDYYLVTRLDGVSLSNAKSLVDKALYAERYLKNRAGQPDHPYHGVAVLDNDSDFDAGHGWHVDNAMRWFDGTNAASPYYADSAAGPWDLVLDNSGLEVGYRGRRAAASSKVESIDTVHSSITLVMHDYMFDMFKPGLPVDISGGVTADVLSVDYDNYKLFLSSVEGIVTGRNVNQWQTDTKAIDDALFFYGFYEFKGHWDVLKFKVGAVGFHMDSGSGMAIRRTNGTWASKALQRNITATSGAITEPFASGVPYGDNFIIPLSYGLSFAEAIYNSVGAATRWMCTHIGDPLYAPFRGEKYEDTTDPEFKYITTRKGGTPDQRIIRMQLAGGDADKDVEVAQFKIEFGISSVTDSVIPYEWGWSDDEIDGYFGDENTRHYFFARDYEWSIEGLTPGQQYYYRVSARDQFGNETSTWAMTFDMSADADTGYNFASVDDHNVVDAYDAGAISVSPNPVRGGAVITVPGGGDVGIYDAGGNMVYSISNTRNVGVQHVEPLRYGFRPVHWNGMDVSGKPVENGTYYVRYGDAVTRIMVVR